MKKKRSKNQLDKIEKYQNLIDKHKDDLWRPKKNSFINENQKSFENKIPIPEKKEGKIITYKGLMFN